MRRVLSSSAAWLVLFSVASADDAPAVTGDLAKLQGVWTGKLGPAEDVPVSYTFRGDAVTIQFHLTGVNARAITLHGKVRVNESATPLKAVDWIALTDTSGKSAPDQPGVYAFLNDDVLRICNGRAGLPRPTTLPDGPPSFLLRRAKNATTEKANP